MMLFDYECPAHGLFEAWGNAGEPSQCPKCSLSCGPCVGSKGIKLNGIKLGFPRANRLWTERHELQVEPGIEY